MKIKTIMLAAAALAAVPSAADAAATVTALPDDYGQNMLFWLFSYNRTEDVKFTLNTTAGPSYSNSTRTTFNDVLVEYAGVTVKADVSFYTDESKGGLGILYNDNSDAITLLSSRNGKALFSGPTSAPVFAQEFYKGHYLEGLGGYQDALLMIEDLWPDGRPVTPAVPEPTTWTMMLVGFGMVGAASRYCRRGVKVTYA